MWMGKRGRRSGGKRREQTILIEETKEITNRNREWREEEEEEGGGEKGKKDEKWWRRNRNKIRRSNLRIMWICFSRPGLCLSLISQHNNLPCASALNTRHYMHTTDVYVLYGFHNKECLFPYRLQHQLIELYNGSVGYHRLFFLLTFVWFRNINGLLDNTAHNAPSSWDLFCYVICLTQHFFIWIITHLEAQLSVTRRQGLLQNRSLHHY